MENVETEVNILNYSFKIRCPNDEVTALKESASYVENKMTTLRGNDKLFNLDRLAITAALNIAHELLTESKNGAFLSHLTSRVNSLSDKIKGALS